MRTSEAFERAAAWVDLTTRGQIRATGEDRVRLIHAICSNDVEGLAPGQGTYAFFLDAQGRIQADSYIFVDRDDLLISCEPDVADKLREHIEGYIIMDDVELEDVSAQTALLGLAGPDAARIVLSMGLQPPAAALTFVRSGDACLSKAPVAGMDGFWIQVPAAGKARLVGQLQALGAVRATSEECETRRVLSGIPRFGADFSSKNIPHETQQLHAISFTKGCYTGQEIVERVRSQGQVRRLLVGIELEAAHPPDERTVRHAGKPVGALTSPTPGLDPGGKSRGFAIVRSEAATPGTPVMLGETAGTVVSVARG